MGTKPKHVTPVAPAQDTGLTRVIAAGTGPTPTAKATVVVNKPEDVTATDNATKTAPELILGSVDIKKTMEQAMKSTEDLVAFNQGNVEAFMKSSQIWTAGIQDLSKQVAATAQANFDETMNAFKALTSAKSLKDAFDMQTNFARVAFEKSVAESGKLTDASFKLTEQALAPISQRVTVAIETIVKPA